MPAALDLLASVEQLVAMETQLLIEAGVPSQPAQDYGSWLRESVEHWQRQPRLPAVWGIHGKLGIATTEVCDFADQFDQGLLGLALPMEGEDAGLRMYFRGRRGLGRGLVWLGGGTSIGVNAATWLTGPVAAVASIIATFVAWGAQLQYDADHE